MEHMGNVTYNGLEPAADHSIVHLAKHALVGSGKASSEEAEKFWYVVER
jgi:hypothetical protein